MPDQALNLDHVFVPLTTPFRAGSGDLDVEALCDNARHFFGTRLGGVVLFGSTGEGPAISAAERLKALAAVRSVAAGKEVMAGVAAESTRRAIRLAADAAETGASAVLVAPPSYFLPQLTAEALRGHYLAIADESPVPVILYQVPLVYSGADLAPELVAELSHHPNIVGIKDSTGNLDAMIKLVNDSAPGFSVIGGSGAGLYGALGVGARGGILAIANLAPSECAELLSRKANGDDKGASELQDRLAPVHKGIVGRYGVPGVKAALDLLGLIGGVPRAPLLPPDSDAVANIQQELSRADLLSSQVPS